MDDLATNSPSPSTMERNSTTPEPANPVAISPGITAATAESSSTTTTMEKAERPSLSYKDLIIEAIESSPEKRLKLNEIYQVSFLATRIQALAFPETSTSNKLRRGRR